ncbi:MAG TPA: polysaccharide deacetylase family protein [Bryobacteraceae bacterium]|nr:polysaccharide deacetylase family protein [Bryobacteraceae bacterium]
MLRRRELFGLLPILQGFAKPPDRLVVLTFDDAVKSHRTFVAPLLKELEFNATFFVSHKWMDDQEHFMSWNDIAELHQMGFEIGNHSWTHADFASPRHASQLAGELALVENELRKRKVPKPRVFAYSGNGFGPEAVAVLRDCGYRLARRGGSPEVEYGKMVIGPALDVSRHHPLLVPTTGDAYPDWTFDHFRKVIAEARNGRIAVLQFHGVPDVAHPWVHTPPEAFRRYMFHLRKEGFRTLALGELAGFYDWNKLPADPMLRVRYREPKKLLLPVEVEATQADLTYWTRNMSEHGYSAEEARRVAGIDVALLKPEGSGLRLAPYPGGRHTRIGFLDGAIDPLRGTKATVFLPWPNSGYVVVDLPEAIFSNLGLLYLAHTHVPTIWNDRNITIPNRDWQRHSDGSLSSESTLPNKVAFGAKLQIVEQAVQMELWLRNGTQQPLTGLRTQVCVLTKGAPDFAVQTNENKLLQQPRAGVRSKNGQHRILTEWEHCNRVWGNANCPCFHSDPSLPDCPPGATVRVTGRLWFY